MAMHLAWERSGREMEKQIMNKAMRGRTKTFTEVSNVLLWGLAGLSSISNSALSVTNVISW
jgi:hypothetical protein